MSLSVQNSFLSRIDIEGLYPRFEKASSPAVIDIANSSLDAKLGGFGVTEAMFKTYPDFIVFLKSISSYMSFFNHTIKVLDNEPAVLFHGKYLKWSKLKQILVKDGALKSLPYGFRYIEKGIQRQNLVKWTKLTPCWMDKLDGEKGHYYLDIISDKKGFLGLSRHCYLHLVDSNRQVYSVGYCGKVYKWLPLRLQKGKFASPDPGEFDKRKEQLVTRIEITREKFLQLKKKIEKDQIEKPFNFHMVRNNCSKYVARVLSELNVKLYNEEYPSQALGRIVCAKLGIVPSKTSQKIIHYIAQFFRVILFPFYLFGLWVAGYFYKNSDVKLNEKIPKPESKKTIDMLRVATGWKVTEWQKFIDKERKAYFEKHPEGVSEYYKYIPEMPSYKDQHLMKPY